MANDPPGPGQARWPMLMDASTAATYLAVSPGSLKRLLAREGVLAVRLGLRLRRWRRSDLDRLVERLSLPVAGETDKELAENALEAVSKRGRGHQGKAPSRASGPR